MSTNGETGGAARSTDTPLLLFNDEFVEFRDLCSFYCDAAVSLMKCEYELEPGSVEGMATLAEELRARGEKLTKMLVSIRSG